MTKSAPAYGTLAEFSSTADILNAAKAIRRLGYTRVDACTPFPVHGLDKVLGVSGSKVPWIVLGGAVTGGLGALAMQVWMNAINYPIRIAGKPFNSLPAFVPVTFELTVLLSAFAAVFGMFALNGLPRPYHPSFSHPTFHKVTDDKFFLVVESKDPIYDGERVRKHLEEAGGANVEEVLS